MARGRLRIKPREIKADPKYKRVDVAKFINKLMLKGKKDVARKLVYDAFDIVKEKSKKDPLEVFETALKNVSPFLEVRPKRIGGAAYQIPMEVPAKRRQHLAMRWLVLSARTRKGKSFGENLASEIQDAANSTGGAVKKKEESHRMAEANKALAYLARIK